MTAKVEVSARNMEVDEAFTSYVNKKASKLDRYLSEIEQVKVDLEYFKSARSATDRFVAQITVRGRRALLRTEERSDEITTAFDATIDKMQRQLERYKGKHYRGRGDGRAAAEVIPVPAEATEEQPSVISRHKTFDLVPMNEMDALEQMKLLGHDNFFIFYNIATDAINVLYRRRDDTYGLIEPKIR
ncbi:MAG TPA: ribosome-associated translation inhibitor RaiA [Anaerolineales bacterium]|nr:ribosome-associated translation inhibitor RaiA [Anaerolineales bacterium]